MPLAEHDGIVVNCLLQLIRFNSRAPRGARPDLPRSNPDHEAVSIHVPLAEHDALSRITENVIKVSIHVPLAEHDIAPGLVTRRNAVST